MLIRRASIRSLEKLYPKKNGMPTDWGYIS